MSGADFRASNLYGTSFAGANLEGALFGNTEISSAIFNGANLKDTNFEDAILDGARVISLVARGLRKDGYEFFGWRTTHGLLIQCGRIMSPEEYWEFVSKEYGADKETFAIIQFIESRAKAMAHEEYAARRKASDG